MWVQIHMCQGVYMCVEATVQREMSSSIILHLIFIPNFSVNWEFDNLARQIDQQVPRILLSSPC